MKKHDKQRGTCNNFVAAFLFFKIEIVATNLLQPSIAKGIFGPANLTFPGFQTHFKAYNNGG